MATGAMHDCCDCDVIPRLHIDAGGDIFMPLAVRRGADDECDDAPCLSVRGAAIVAPPSDAAGKT